MNPPHHSSGHPSNAGNRSREMHIYNGHQMMPMHQNMHQYPMDNYGMGQPHRGYMNHPQMHRGHHPYMAVPTDYRYHHMPNYAYGNHLEMPMMPPNYNYGMPMEYGNQFVMHPAARQNMQLRPMHPHQYVPNPYKTNPMMMPIEDNSHMKVVNPGGSVARSTLKSRKTKHKIQPTSENIQQPRQIIVKTEPMIPMTHASPVQPMPQPIIAAANIKLEPTLIETTVLSKLEPPPEVLEEPIVSEPPEPVNKMTHLKSINKCSQVINYMSTPNLFRTSYIRSSESCESFGEASRASMLLGMATIMGCEDMVQIALSSDSIDVNVSDRNGRTPLHHAANMNQCNILKALLVAGANTKIRDNLGSTAVEIAYSAGNTDILKIFENFFQAKYPLQFKKYPLERTEFEDDSDEEQNFYNRCQMVLNNPETDAFTTKQPQNTTVPLQSGSLRK